MTTQKTSILINRQLPEFIKEEYPLFQTFLEAYYEYLETKQTGIDNDLITRAKELRYSKDVDSSLEDFQDQFINTYLSLFPQNTEVDKAFLIKNILPIYLAKGTEKSFNLLFRILFNEDMKYSRPSENILKASDGEWVVEKKLKLYKNITSTHTGNGTKTSFPIVFEIQIQNIEVYVNNTLQANTSYYVQPEKQLINFNTAPTNNSTIEIIYKDLTNFNSQIFVNRQVTGITSGATLIIEKVLEEDVNEQNIISLFYVDKNYIGNFLGKEYVNITVFNSYSEEITLKLQTISFVSKVNVINAGSTYNVGDPILIIGGEIPAIAEVKTTNANGNITSILVTSRGKNFDTIPTANLSQRGNGLATANVSIESPIEILSGKFTSSKGLLSAEEIRLESQKYYHNYSYIISTQVSFNSYKNIFKNLLHPSGFQEYGEWSKIVEVNEAEKGEGESVSTNANIPTSTGTVSVQNNSIYITGTNTSFTNIFLADAFLQSSTGSSTSAAIKTYKQLFMWGDNLYGELGLNDRVHRSSPVQVGTSSWSQVSCENGSTFAIKYDGTLWAWGNNFYGGLGLNNTVSRSSPVQIGTSSWSLVSAGNDHTLAIRSDGTLFTWGDNTDGQLGSNNFVHRSSPIQVGTSSWSQVAVGYHSLAILSNGTLWAWGGNLSGQLGLNFRTSRSSPVQVGTSSWSQVSCGTSYTMAIKYDGTLWAWGNNSLGQLGTNSRIHRSSPVQIGTSSWSLVSAGNDYTLAIRSDGRLFAWGYNILGGQLGTGDTVHRSSPTQIGTDSWLQVSAGSINTLGIESDGSLYAWGYNDPGQLGLNDTASRFSPVLVAANGIGSLSNDALKTGQYISINNQIRIVNTLISNTNISVTVAFTANSSNQELHILV
jgi:alpha-tubulin suppressor-like RCC1 family protein